MTKESFIKQYEEAMKEYNFIGVEVQVENNPCTEYIINKSNNFESKLEYYKNAYDDDMKLKANKSIAIIDVLVGNNLSLSA